MLINFTPPHVVFVLFSFTYSWLQIAAGERDSKKENTHEDTAPCRSGSAAIVASGMLPFRIAML